MTNEQLTRALCEIVTTAGRKLNNEWPSDCFCADRFDERHDPIVSKLVLDFILHAVESTPGDPYRERIQAETDALINS